MSGSRPDPGAVARLRPTQESDLDHVMRWERDPENSPFVGQWSREEHRHAMTAPDRQHWIIETVPAHEAVGFVIGLDLGNVGLGVHLKRIVVSEKGRRIGRTAVAQFTSRAFAEKRPPFVWLDVLGDNLRAQAAYRAAGYRVKALSPAEREVWAKSVGGIGEQNLVMICESTPGGTTSGTRPRLSGRAIALASAAVYALVGASFLLKADPGPVGFDIHLLPRANAVLNTLTTLFLAAAYLAIRRKNVRVHRRLIYAAFTTTGLFLLTYLTYHFLSGSTRFGGSGPLAAVYYFLLLSHVLLAMVIVPLALATFARGIANRVPEHRAMARWTMPLWLYVSISGVLVYLLISPYYGNG